MIDFSSQIFNLAPKNLKVIILCSSGVDSIAASHYFLQKYRDRYEISLLHFNHKLRDQNDQMEASFQVFASSIYASWSIQRLSCKNNTEDSCRKARLEHLNSYKNVVFITAHHLDDCAESYLLNCIRGKEGFLPIPFHTELPCSNYINRPFLFNRKRDFMSYAERHDLAQFVVEDETNTQVKGSRRNLLRNKILPILEEENVGLQTIVKKKMQTRLNTLCS